MKSDLLQKIQEKHKPNSYVEIRFVINGHGKERSTVIGNGLIGDRRKRYEVMNFVNPVSNIIKDLSVKKDTFCNQKLSFKLVFSSCYTANEEEYPKNRGEGLSRKTNPTIVINQEQYHPETNYTPSVFSEKYFNNDNNTVNSLLDKFYLAIPKDARPLIESLEATNGVSAACNWLPDSDVAMLGEKDVKIQIVNTEGWKKHNENKLNRESSVCAIM